MIDRTWARVALAILLLHVVLVPALFFGIAEIVQHSSEETFANQVRMNARLVADELERLPVDRFVENAMPILDGAILSGRCVFADIVVDGKSRRSPLSNSYREEPVEDFVFGDHGDNVYYVGMPVPLENTTAKLRLGFDEAPTLAEIATSRQRLLVALLLYAAASLMVGAWFGWSLVRPVQALQAAAARVRAGDRERSLTTTTRLWEVRQLATELEFMRVELVGANERLRQEAVVLESVQRERGALEVQLQEKKRLETIGTLAGGIAHEFNNILVPILLYSEDALESLSADSEVRHDIEHVVKAAQRARRLISEVLTFSRGRDSQRSEIFELEPILIEVTDFLRKMVPPSIEIKASAAPSCPKVRGDPTLVHQLLMNLSINGYQSMRDRGGLLEIRIEPVKWPGDDQVARGDYVVLSVSDQGHGIETEYLGRIFDPFFTTRDIGDGTGLGLSVVHGVATSLGATVTVESQVEKGSVFRVYIPVSAAESIERVGA